MEVLVVTNISNLNKDKDNLYKMNKIYEEDEEKGENKNEDLEKDNIIENSESKGICYIF